MAVGEGEVEECEIGEWVEKLGNMRVILAAEHENLKKEEAGDQGEVSGFERWLGYLTIRTCVGR